METKIVRKIAEPFLKFISRPFIFLKINPNLISFLSLVTAIIFCLFLSVGNFILASLMVLLSGLFDVIDGQVARALGKATLLGKFLDRTLDKINDSIIISAFILLGLVDLRLGIYALATMLLATNVSANIEAVLNLKISDAFSMRFLRIILIALFIPFKEFNVLFIILSVITTYSLLDRIFIAIKNKNTHGIA